MSDRGVSSCVKGPLPRLGWRTIAGGIVAAATVGALVSGCGGGDDARQTQVITVQTTVAGKSTETTISPLERGKVRREILNAARAGLAAWMKNDLGAMGTYFAEDQVSHYRDLAEGYAKENKVRVRLHEFESLDVTEIAATGKEALVEYYFKDQSYFASDTGEPLSEPSRDETMIQFTLKQTDNGWIIQRMIAKSDAVS